MSEVEMDEQVNSFPLHSIQIDSNYMDSLNESRVASAPNGSNPTSIRSAASTAPSRHAASASAFTTVSALHSARSRRMASYSAQSASLTKSSMILPPIMPEVVPISGGSSGRASPSTAPSSAPLSDHETDEKTEKIQKVEEHREASSGKRSAFHSDKSAYSTSKKSYSSSFSSGSLFTGSGEIMDSDGEVKSSASGIRKKLTKGVLDYFCLLQKSQVMDPKDVYIVNLNDSGLHKVKSTGLRKFVNLHDVDAGENPGLTVSDFRYFTGLKTLSLPCNEIRSFDSWKSTQFLQLENLDLSYNFLTVDSIRIIGASIPNLLHLSLVCNSLTQFPFRPEGANAWFSNLRQLDVENNRLNDEPSLRALAQLALLHKLNLSKNAIECLPIFEKTDFQSLEEINLTHNKLDTESSLVGLVNLSALRKAFVYNNAFVRGEKHVSRDLKGILHNVDLIDRPVKSQVSNKSRFIRPMEHRRQGLKKDWHVFKVSEISAQQGVSSIPLFFPMEGTVMGRVSPIHQDVLASYEKLNTVAKSLIDEHAEKEKKDEEERVNETLQTKESVPAPPVQDNTFLTGVPLLQTQAYKEKQTHVPRGDFEFDNQSDEYWDTDDDEFLDIIAGPPPSLAAAYRALRQAVTESFTTCWETSQHHFEKPTVASQLKQNKKDENLFAQFYKMHKDQRKIQGGVTAIEPDPALEEAEKRHQHRLQPFPRRINFKKVLPKVPVVKPVKKTDEQRLQEMMKQVESRILIMETSLVTILGNDYLQQQMPDSQQLLEEIQDEYQRLKAIFLPDPTNPSPAPMNHDDERYLSVPSMATIESSRSSSTSMNETDDKKHVRLVMTPEVQETESIPSAEQSALPSRSSLAASSMEKIRIEIEQDSKRPGSARMRQ